MFNLKFLIEMKKLTAILCMCSLMTIGCKNNKEVPAVVAEDPEVQEQVDPEMEKCKAQCEAWQNWDQQSDEQKAELISARKEKITEREAMKAECEAKRAEFEAQKAEFEKTWAEKWANFDNLNMEEQKELIDNYMKFNCPKHGCKGGDAAPKCGKCCCKEGKCCKGGEEAPKCKHGEGKCQHNPAQCPNHEKADCPHAK